MGNDTKWRDRGREFAEACKFFAPHLLLAPFRAFGIGGRAEGWHALAAPLFWLVALGGSAAAKDSLPKLLEWWNWPPALLWSIYGVMILAAFLQGVWEGLRGRESAIIDERDDAMESRDKAVDANRQIVEQFQAQDDDTVQVIRALSGSDAHLGTPFDSTIALFLACFRDLPRPCSDTHLVKFLLGPPPHNYEDKAELQGYQALANEKRSAVLKLFGNNALIDDVSARETALENASRPAMLRLPSGRRYFQFTDFAARVSWSLESQGAQAPAPVRVEVFDRERRLIQLRAGIEKLIRRAKREKLRGEELRIADSAHWAVATEILLEEYLLDDCAEARQQELAEAMGRNEPPRESPGWERPFTRLANGIAWLVRFRAEVSAHELREEPTTRSVPRSLDFLSQ